MKRIVLSCLVVLLTLTGASPALAQGGNDLFQQALRKERIDGDLKAAIALYQRILKEQGADRALCAKTLVQLGQAYEKLGNADAKSSYQRVIRDYAEQSEQVSVARARLGALSAGAVAATNGPAVRRLWSGPEVDPFGGPTRDGRLLTFTDWNYGNVAVRDLISGENRLLTNKPDWADLSYALYSMPSPDGRRVAYAWSVDTREKSGQAEFELRLIAMDGGEPRVLFADPDIVYLQPSEWSPDGKQIVATLVRKDNTSQIGLIDAITGSMRILKSLDWRGPGKMSFSPDGKYLAFDLPASESAPQRDIHVLAIDGSAESVLVRHAAEDVVMGWAPDGKYVLFASDRTGNRSLWLAPVEDGKPAGEAVLVRRDTEFAASDPLGFTQNGAFLYSSNLSPMDMYVATIDAASGKSIGVPARLVDHLIGANRAADWTRDGTAVVYVSERQGLSRAGSGSLIVRTLADGTERIVPKHFGSLTSPRWSPDGRYIVGNGQDQKGRQGIYRVDPQSGEATMLVGGGGRAFAGWLDAGSSFVYLIQDVSQQVLALVRQRLDTGEARDLVRLPFKRNMNLYQAEVSPDGRHVAFAIVPDSASRSALRVVSAEGGEPRELFQAPPRSGIGSLAWSTDGRSIFFVLTNEEDARVMCIAAGGGPARETGVVNDRIRYLRAHPDGQRIGYSGGSQAREVWILENFLPRTETPAKAKQR